MERDDLSKANGSEMLPVKGGRPGYVLDAQIGFVLRKAQQRHWSIFSEYMREGLTAQQFATLAKLLEVGPSSQNALGRLTGMDNSTINGVVSRLYQRGLIDKMRAPSDGRMHLVHLTKDGERMIRSLLPIAQEITRRTLAPLSRSERAALMRLLRKIS